MKTGRILALGVCALTMAIVTGCGNKQQKSAESVDQTTVAADSASMTSKYTGTLPAADCPGIRTTLVLKYTKTGADNRFELTEEYIDRKTFNTSGNFNTERGFGDDNDATVIILNYDKPDNEQRYYMWFSKDPKVMHVLTPNKELVKEKTLSFTLKQEE